MSTTSQHVGESAVITGPSNSKFVSLSLHPGCLLNFAPKPRADQNVIRVEKARLFIPGSYSPFKDTLLLSID